MRVLHAIHDFLPRHRAGSEIYAFELARAQSARHDVFVLAAEYDPSTAHGTIRWRSHGGLTVIEIVNNWEFERFEESYSSPRINAQLRHVLDAARPDVVHVHNLLNLSFDLPRMAHERGISTVATLHDYTLVCAAGGQRVHVADSHVCGVIDPERCSRCFVQSPLHAQMAAGRLTRHTGGRLLAKAGAAIHRLAPSATVAAAGALRAGDIHAGDMARRLSAARSVLETIDLVVAPSPSIAAEFERLGLDRRRLEVSDYGFVPAAPGAAAARPIARGPLRIGFVGTLVWHKGAHVLLDAARRLAGEYEIHIHGDTAVFPGYVAQLARLDPESRVRFHGGFDRDRLGEVYGAIDVLVVPSLWLENSPLVIHEAFMHRVPVIGARIGGIADLVADGVSGLLYDPFDPEALAAAVQRVMDDRGLLGRLSTAAPRVKTIGEDAAEWDARYAAVRARSIAAAAATP